MRSLVVHGTLLPHPHVCQRRPADDCLRLGVAEHRRRPSRGTCSTVIANCCLAQRLDESTIPQANGSAPARVNLLGGSHRCYSPSGSNPLGRRGGSLLRLDGLHFGQGIPPPPQWQPWGPLNGWSGWVSQTQSSPSQSRQAISTPGGASTAAGHRPRSGRRSPADTPAVH
jgi:hypothetical protein